jgi:hypothetical protein
MAKKIDRVAPAHQAPPGARHVVPDADYIADLEMTDSQRSKRMTDRMAGKPVRRPQPR